MTKEIQKIDAGLQAEIEMAGRIEAVPTILDVVCRTTGMGFAAVARVTEERWIACGVLDKINFGLTPGGELSLETTICNEIRQSHEAVIIDNVGEDPAWCGHHTPARYGFQSYISVPIILSDGSFFGTLCAIDPRPARLKTPETIGMFRLFADLIARNLDDARKIVEIENSLRAERVDAELREQFIAVLGHDLRTPLRAIRSFSELLERKNLPDQEAMSMLRIMRQSASRMAGLIDNLLDFARGRLGGGITLSREMNSSLEPVLREVIAEHLAFQPDRIVKSDFALMEPINCDPARVAQLFSNILGNAFTYGTPERPVHVRAASDTQGFQLSVANSGEAIPAATMERLFHPFYRAALRQNREGLGLGLYIAHQIATAHGGTLSVESTPEETRFTFRMEF